MLEEEERGKEGALQGYPSRIPLPLAPLLFSLLPGFPHTFLAPIRVLPAEKSDVSFECFVSLQSTVKCTTLTAHTSKTWTGNI